MHPSAVTGLCLVSLLAGGIAVADPGPDEAALRAERDRLRAWIDTAGRLEPLGAELQATVQASARLDQSLWATMARICDVEIDATAQPGTPAVGLRHQRWDLQLRGQLDDIACLALGLTSGGNLFAIESLRVDPTTEPARARGRLFGHEWYTVPAAIPPPPPAEASPPPPATGSALEREVAALRHEAAALRARLGAQEAHARARDEAITAARARMVALEWHSRALKATRRVNPLNASLLLTADTWILAGELLSADDRALIEEVPLPSYVLRHMTGLHDPRPSRVKLPVVPAESDGKPLVQVDAFDAPAAALAILLGDRLLVVHGPGRSPTRFTGRIDAGRPLDALKAMRAALPASSIRALAAHALPEPAARPTTAPPAPPPDGLEREVSLQLVDVDLAELAPLIAEASGEILPACAARVGISVGGREIPAAALQRTLEARLANDPRCPAKPDAAYVPSDVPDDPRPDWRLTATLRDGTTRTALFEAPDGRLHLIADRGEWDEEFRAFDRGRVALPQPAVYLLEPHRPQ